MVSIEGNHIFIVPSLKDATGICHNCGLKAELRPYGKNGVNVCFACGMKDEKEALKQFKKQFK